MALRTKPRWDKYDGYMGNFRGTLAADIADDDFNKVLGVGLNSDGAIVVGSGVTGIKGLMIVSVGADIHGNLLEGGTNNQAGDTQDVGKHGEIVNFVPTDVTNDYLVTVTVGSGTFTVKTKQGSAAANTSGAIAFGGTAANVKTGVVAADDDLDAADVTVTGTAPNFVVTLPDGWSLVADAGATVTPNPASLDAAAGTNYYAHADGSVTGSKGSDGIYVGHTAESTRLIVNVLDATP